MTGSQALVIGASGGIGGALAVELSARGLEVTRLSRSGNQLDLASQSSVDRLLSPLDGPFDIILVAAGVLAPGGGRPEKSLAEIEAEAMLEVMAVNAVGPALVLRHVPRLLPRHGRCVVAVLTARVGSIGDNRMGGWYAYRASKAAANQIVHTAAIEIGRKNAQAIVVALHPGTVDTAFTQAYRQHPKVSPETAARNLIDCISGLRPEDTGGFFDYAGKPVPW
ncbi:SDR family NAD(P)-dependent oxidoreductase [Mesorhizobium sp. CAU 1741]|uniref:SDR family NAD(P)-dependent oxidoreductase n=1 Tax=Mesorhizobium sp. CAU 1741 TaxID=3140366 RepID=UPI00325B8090